MVVSRLHRAVYNGGIKRVCHLIFSIEHREAFRVRGLQVQPCSAALALLQAEMRFLLSVSPPLGDDLRMYREMVIAGYGPLSTNSISREYLPLYNLCVVKQQLGYQIRNMLGASFLKMMPKTGQHSWSRSVTVALKVTG